MGPRGAVVSFRTLLTAMVSMCISYGLLLYTRELVFSLLLVSFKNASLACGHAGHVADYSRFRPRASGRRGGASASGGSEGMRRGKKARGKASQQHLPDRAGSTSRREALLVVQGSWIIGCELAILAAATNGHAACIRLLLADDMSSPYIGSDKCRSLILAATNGHAVCVGLLLAAGVRTSAYATSEALVAAASNGHAACVPPLLAPGVGTDAGSRADALVAAASNGHAACIPPLLAAGVRTNADATSEALVAAASNGHAACIPPLLAPGVSTDAWSRGNALVNAATAGHAACIPPLLAVVGPGQFGRLFPVRTTPEPTHLPVVSGSAPCEPTRRRGGGGLHSKPLTRRPKTRRLRSTVNWP